MTAFQASNGYQVHRLTYGGLSVQSADDPVSVYIPKKQNVQALREFFAQERCDDMPFRHGDCWVFPQSDTSGGDRRVAVLVPGEGFVVYREDRLPGYVEGLQPSGYLAAAKAYFAAHPKHEPKPWLDAQSGEVWSVSDGDEGGLAVCRREPDQDNGDDHPYFYGPNFDGIRGDALTAGTRLEVQS